MKKGIDLSYSNGNIDMAKVKESGIDFIILRLGYGKSKNQIDSKFYENYNKALQFNIPIGVYLYSYAHNCQDALDEAKLVIDVVTSLKLEYPIFIDMEDADGYKSRNNIDYSTCIDICETFCEYIESFGYYVGIYANLDWLNNKINSDRLDRFDKWVAQWSSICDYKKDYGLWQYSSKGFISGIQGNVDMNYALKDYPSIIYNNNLNHLKDITNLNNLDLKYIYTVQAGDTLSKIALKYNTSWEKIYKHNRETIGDNPNYIKIGQKLIIRED